MGFELHYRIKSLFAKENFLYLKVPVYTHEKNVKELLS